MAGFAFALDLDANEIHVEMHIELCCSLSRYRESHLTSIKAVHLHLWLVFAFVLALDANEIHVEMHIELCCSLSRYRESHLKTIKAVHIHLWLVLHLRQPLTPMRSRLKST